MSADDLYVIPACSSPVVTESVQEQKILRQMPGAEFTDCNYYVFPGFSRIVAALELITSRMHRD